jgi:hypothetical protein
MVYIGTDKLLPLTRFTSREWTRGHVTVLYSIRLPDRSMYYRLLHICPAFSRFSWRWGRRKRWRAGWKRWWSGRWRERRWPR